MSTASVGVSSYGDLRGVTQFIESGAAAQLNSLNHEFAAHFGYPFSVNEGIRDHARQLFLYTLYLEGKGALAAYASILPLPQGTYTSTHDPSIGNATDLGVTMANGVNRALTTVEHSWIITNGYRRGVRWTGATFSKPEFWHFNTYPAQATVAPISNVSPAGGGTPIVIPKEVQAMQQGRYFRNTTATIAGKKNPNFGSVVLADPISGFAWHVPAMAYVPLCVSLGFAENATIHEVPDNQWTFVTRTIPAYAK